jgi:hypothetical protein
MRIRNYISSIALMLVAFTSSFAQVRQPVRTADLISTVVVRHRTPPIVDVDKTLEAIAANTADIAGLTSTLHYANTVEIIARHADGTVFYSHKSHNLLTNAGKDLISKAVSDTAAQPAACNYIALTNTAITPAAGDTTLSGEITTNGLARAQAAFAHTNGTSTYTLTKTFTASATQASQAAGVFNASSAGSMCFENTYTQVTLNNTDTLTVTWTITLS